MHRRNESVAKPYSSIDVVDVPLQSQGKANNTPSRGEGVSNEERAAALDFLVSAAERE